jgi:RHS repeat-associated protein
MYSTNVTTFTNEVGNSWVRTVDSFGRLTNVTEPAPGGNVSTAYTYDGLGNVQSIIQAGNSGNGEAARSYAFNYDSLSHLITSISPEAGATCYGVRRLGTLGHPNECIGGYDANGNRLYKTDARGVTVSNTYDALNRLLSTSAPAIGVTGATNGQTVPAINNQYIYDVATVGNFSAQNPIGRLVQQSNGTNASTQYSYDPMGRVALQTNVLPDSSGDLTVNPVTAAYDLAGNLADLTYPDGRHIHQTFDGAGRLLASNLVDIGGVLESETYLQSISYFPDGSPNMITLGNGVQQIIGETSRLQVQGLAVTSPSGSPLSPVAPLTLLSRSYCYVNCSPVAGGTAGTANNGNIWQIADGLKPTKTQDFTYDSLNRIHSFSLGGTVNQQFQIDSFGNMAQTLGDAFVPSFIPPAGQQPTNQITNLPCALYTPSQTGYDVVGNQQCSTDQYGGTSLYSYDAENRISQINALNSASPFVSYVYGPDGERVRKNNADGTLTEYIYFGGQVISERDDAYQWTDYIFAAGRRIARLRAEDVWLGTAGTDPNNPTGATWTVPTPTNPDGSAYTVKAGDQLCVRQYDTTDVVSGPVAAFSNGMSTSGWMASDGSPLGALVGGWPTAWAERCADLSGGGATAGASITSLGVNTATTQDAGALAGFALYADMTIISTDGTVTPISMTVTSGPQTSTMNAGTGYPYMDNSGANGLLSPHYFVSDQLGTAQLEIAEGGWPVYSGQFAPFGQEIQNGQYLPQTQPDGSTSNYKFTGKERDAESGLDYFGARYYSSNMGRWSSPDPSGLAYADPTNPQSLNLYSYVLNNPLAFTDPDGLECVWDDGSFDSADDKDTGSHSGCSAAGGTYVDPKAFSTIGAGDWSGQANSQIAQVASTLSGDNNYTNVTVNANGSGYTDQTYMNLADNTQYLLTNDSSHGADPITELATDVTADSNHMIGCIAQAYGAGGPGETTRRLGQPVEGTKPFITPGTSRGTSPISEYARSLPRVKGNFRAPVGGPGTGTELRMARTGSLNVAAARYAPFVGLALDVIAVGQLANCLGH